MLSKVWTEILVVIAIGTSIAWMVLVCREKDVRPLRDFAMFCKKQTKTGRVIFGLLFLALFVFASVKPNGEMRNVANVEVLPIINSYIQLTTNTTRTITAADFERGFVQTYIGTD